MNYYRKFLKVLRIIKEKYTTYFSFEHTRPLYARDYNIISDRLKQPISIAVVIQGPLITKNNFTVETIKLYKKTFSPTTKLIVSTWSDCDQNIITTLRAMGVVVLLNDKPKQSGIGNINLQISSTKSGIQEAKKSGVNYILKTRTDIRMYAPNIESYLYAACTMYPVSKEYSQEKRIVAFSLNTYKYRPYSISDLTLFGTLHDMEKYFNVPEDTRTAPHFKDIGSWSNGRFCEVYLSTHFLENIGRKLSYTLEDSWKVYAEHFCVVDSNSVELFWYKYTYWEEYRDLGYAYMKNNQELHFREWLILYFSLNNKASIPENVLGEVFGTKMNTDNI